MPEARGANGGQNISDLRAPDFRYARIAFRAGPLRPRFQPIHHLLRVSIFFRHYDVRSSRVIRESSKFCRTLRLNWELLENNRR